MVSGRWSEREDGCILLSRRGGGLWCNLGMLKERNPVAWVPTLYFAQGLPYVVVTSVVGLALLRLGWTAVEVAAYTGALTLPWVIKPLWGPLVERVGTRRGWTLVMEAACAILLLALAVVLPHPHWMPLTMGLLLAMGFASSTHDIAADGLYLMALGTGRQAAWSGVRSAFFKLSILAGTGGMVWLAGKWEGLWGTSAAWTGAFAVGAAGLMLIYGYHYFQLPRPPADTPPAVTEPWWEQFVLTLAAFVERPGFGQILAFLLFYRIGEGQLLKGNLPFFLAARDAGGLGMKTEEIGWLYGTLGITALIFGGIAGGLVIARTGLRRQLWWMAVAMNLPHLIYMGLAWAQPDGRWVIGAGITLEQLGYGYGFSAYMVYALFVARGAHPTAHYALCTGTMALGLMLANYLAAGALYECAGNYFEFFCWVMLCSVLSLVTLWKLPLDREFGQREIYREHAKTEPVAAAG
jgi:PAT family beta-lactamase induction signal transducer AmpG